MKQRINLLLITATTKLIACSSGNDIFDDNYENTSSNSAQLQKSVDRCQPTTQRFWLP